MKKIFIALLVMSIAFLFGCTSQEKPQEVKRITPQEAKGMIDEKNKVIILDVRTEEEFNEGHLEGAILIPDYEITEKAEDVLTNKEATIIVYCRSGRRSSAASETLSQLGYSNIYDMGGIIDWPYEIVTE